MTMGRSRRFARKIGSSGNRADGSARSTAEQRYRGIALCGLRRDLQVPNRMSKKSAGLLLFRETAAGLEVLLAHPGGPLWAKKDAGSWSIPTTATPHHTDPSSAPNPTYQQ